MATKYIALLGQVVGGGGAPFTVEYGFDGEQFTTRKAAIRHGLKIRESDDFNIGVIENGKLVRLDWMDQPSETDPDELAKIAEQLDLEER